MRWRRRHSSRRTDPSGVGSLLDGLDLRTVLAEHHATTRPVAAEVAWALNGRTVDSVSWDEGHASLQVRCGDAACVLAVGAGQPVEHIVSMVSLEPVVVTAAAGGGRVLLEFASRSWTYAIVATPAVS